MPIITDRSGREREVSQTEYEGLKGQFVSSGSDYATFARYETDRGRGVNLLDTVDGTTLKVLDETHAERKYLKKIVWRCSACTFTTPAEGTYTHESIFKHIDATLLSSDEHQDAFVTTMQVENYTKHQCSTCGVQFLTLRDFNKHIEIQKNGRAAHKNASALFVHRFVRSGSAVPEPLRIVAHDGVFTDVEIQQPVSRQTERKRHRRGKRGGRRNKQGVGA
tara:strand:+ start:577 stop:1239 length:663 start_codon:yes stop_codon:yes gene_type:complete